MARNFFMSDREKQYLLFRVTRFDNPELVEKLVSIIERSSDLYKGAKKAYDYLTNQREYSADLNASDQAPKQIPPRLNVQHIGDGMIHLAWNRDSFYVYKSEDLKYFDDEKTFQKSDAYRKGYLGVFELKSYKGYRYITHESPMHQGIKKIQVNNDDEWMFRTETETTKAGDIQPLVKIDVQQGLVYYIDQEKSTEDELYFQKPERVRFMRINWIEWDATKNEIKKSQKM